MNRAVSQNVAVASVFPDVCVVQTITTQLLQRGMSAVGARQLLAGDMVTGLGDRMQIVSLIHAEKNQDISAERRRAELGNRTETVDQNESITLHQRSSIVLGHAGVSMMGVAQCLSWQPVTKATDRQRLAAAVIRLLDRHR